MPERAQSLLRSCVSLSWSQARAGRIGHSGIPPSWRGARSTSTYDFSVKRVPWAQAAGASGAGRCLDSRLPEVPGRMWLSLEEGRNPSDSFPPKASLGKGLQPVAPVSGSLEGGAGRRLWQNWGRRGLQPPFSRGLPSLSSSSNREPRDVKIHSRGSPSKALILI